MHTVNNFCDPNPIIGTPEFGPVHETNMLSPYKNRLKLHN
jgi:hypothetical protein